MNYSLGRVLLGCGFCGNSLEHVCIAFLFLLLHCPHCHPCISELSLGRLVGRLQAEHLLKGTDGLLKVLQLEVSLWKQVGKLTSCTARPSIKTFSINIIRKCFKHQTMIDTSTQCVSRLQNKEPIYIPGGGGGGGRDCFIGHHLI